MEPVRPLQKFLPFKLNQYVVYVIGCVLFSFGVLCFIQAKLGADPLYVFSSGLASHFSWMTIGMAEGGFAALMLAIWAVANKRIPIISPFITFFFCGTLIDIGKHTKIAAKIMPYDHAPLMVTGLIFCAYASALIIMSGIGIRAMDLIAITLVEWTKKPFWIYKTILEAMLLTTGWLLGGKVGMGTFAFLVVVDLLVQPFMRANEKFLGMKNHGLRHTEAVDPIVPVRVHVAA
jgi:uncharacterized protein